MSIALKVLGVIKSTKPSDKKQANESAVETQSQRDKRIIKELNPSEVSAKMKGGILLNIWEFSFMLGCSKRTAQELQLGGLINSVRIGSRVLFKPDDITALIATRTVTHN